MRTATGRLADENELLRKIARAFPAGRQTALGLGIGDDAALLRPRARHEVVLTCDWFLEGSHFLRDKHPADSVGWKSLARAVSDIAAMGGVPRCFLLGLALPANATGDWMSAFLGGLQRASAAFACQLAGGDTTRREEILINVTVVGEVRQGRAVRRAGARAGDQLFVTGTLGEAENGLRRLGRSKKIGRWPSPALQKHLYPAPRLAVGKWLAESQLVSSMMDVSDGLSTDLARLCAASGVGALIEARDLPVSRQAVPRDRLTLALDGGEDYELLFTVRPAKASRIPAELAGVAVTKIGQIMPGKTILLKLGNDCSRIEPKGWDPFR